MIFSATHGANDALPGLWGIVLLTLILGGSVAGLLAMYSENLKKKLSGTGSLRSRQLPEEEKSTLPLEAYSGGLMSVTERTTNLLEKDDVIADRGIKNKK